jgi:2-methylisocitrate lyase-like PEP mutase family enzyme
MTPGAQLRAVVDRQTPPVVPLALDGLAAKTAESAGFEALYVGGGALGYLKTYSEANLTLNELVDVGLEIRAASSLPLVLDGTCGWGDPMHQHRTMALAETAGFAAIEIEDQLLPKRAHHHVNVEHLIPEELMADKIRECVAARRDPDFVVIARTNACRTDDLDTALRRAELYREAGADMLLLLPRTPEQAEAIGTRIEGPLVYMCLAGLPSMGMSVEDAGRLGYRMVIDATTPLFARQRALRLCYEAIARGEVDPTFGTDYAAEVATIHELIGLDAMLSIERRTVER